MESFTVTEYKAINGINGDTVVHLDSARTEEEAIYVMGLLEASESWCLMMINQKKEMNDE